jgi:anti-sigma B factor antagonist
MTDSIRDNPAQQPTFRVPSDIDTSTVWELKPQLLTELRDHGPMLVLDLEAVQFIDSTGLGMLVSILKEARQAGGGVRLINPNREVLRLLQITGLERVFEIGGPYPASN